MQKPMVFLPQLLARHGLRLGPVPGPRLGSAIHRNWARHKPLTEFEALLHHFVDNGKLDLDAFQLPVRIPVDMYPSNLLYASSHMCSLLPGCTFDMLSSPSQTFGEQITGALVHAAGTGFAFCLLGRHGCCEHAIWTR